MSLGEFELIERLFKPLARGYAGALDLTDDAAIVRLEPGHELVIAKDAIVEGVHYLPEDPPDLVAGKLLRVNLSDLAAMGARPLGYLMALARPTELDLAYIEGLARGLARDQAEFGLYLLGGDTVRTTGPLVLTLTILGTVPIGGALRRSGAREGDLLFASGTLGDAALGLRVLRGLAAPEDVALALVDRYRTPRPRVRLGVALRGLASAAIDLSDGLVADLGHLLETSGVGAVLETSKLPLSDAARELPGAFEAALSGGDDYELLFTAPEAARPAIVARSAECGVPVAAIGRIRVERGLTALSAEGRPIKLAGTGWRHF